jgi:ZIP family zinc transporter
MPENMQFWIAFLLPFLGTSIGAGSIFFFKNNLNLKIRKALVGFAAGVMVAASVWALLIPAITLAEKSGIPSFIPPVIGFVIGILFLLVLDKISAKINLEERFLEKSSIDKDTFMLILAVTLHNIPEGMAIGVVLASVISGKDAVSMSEALILSAGIAAQNFPEGAIISAPLVSRGLSKNKSFIFGVLSGVVEPIGAGITIFLTSLVLPILPFVLAFAAGAMIYVVVEELIPEMHQDFNSDIGILSLTLGFSLMMLLDVALG